jgi:hypothetical protein
VALLGPFFLYAWMLSLLVRGQLGLVGFSPRSLALPVMGIGALPAAIFVMSLLFALSELALLRIDFTKGNILKKYTLAWGGIRKSIFFEVSDIRYIKRFGIAAGAALAVSVLIALLL